MLKAQTDGIGALRQQIRNNLGTLDVSTWQQLHDNSLEMLENFKRNGEGDNANKAWFLSKLSGLKLMYLVQFQNIKKSLFYEAWCLLEQIELDSVWLNSNKFYAPEKFGIPKMQNLVAKWQALFPYKVFLSPAYRKKSVECSICGLSRDPWSKCNHKLGKVYGGRQCISIVRSAELLEVSLVTDPVQKYSVAREVIDEAGNRVDNHNYPLLSFVAKRLRSPYSYWEMEWTKICHPHALFPRISPDDPCPCESGRVYSTCCQVKPGILRPHAQFWFDEEPPSNFPRLEFSGYEPP